jgi:hypothetical protein
MTIEDDEGGMVRDVIVLPDGRYLIFYAFDDADDGNDREEQQ